MKFVDAHIHLSDPEYSSILDKVIEDAEKSNVVALVSNSMDLETSKRSLQLAKKYPGLVFAAVGVHPCNVIASFDKFWQKLSWSAEPVEKNLF